MEAVIAPEEKRITLEGEKEEYETFQSVWLRNRSRAAATLSCPVLWKVCYVHFLSVTSLVPISIKRVLIHVY